MQDFIYRNRHWWGALTLLVATVGIYYQTDRYLDVEFSDESYYMQCGLELFDKLTLHWGPTYNLWYKLLSLFTDNPINLYYISFALTGAMVPLLLYWLLLRWRIPFVIACWISFCFMTSEQHVTTFARVTHFAVLLFLLSLIISTYLRSKTVKMALVLGGCLLASYARPELTFGLILMLIFYGWQWFRKRKQVQGKTHYVLLIFGGIVVVNMALSSWNSFELFGYKRDIIAFYDHYTLKMNMQKNDYAYWEYWDDIAEKYFGGKKQFTDVLTAYPKEVLRHVFFNMVLYVILLAKWTGNFILPFALTEEWNGFLYVAVVCLLSAILLVVWLPARRNRFKVLLQQHSENLIILALFGLPSLLACALIFPRFHYIYQQLPFFLLLLAILLQSLLPDKQMIAERLKIPALLLLLTVVLAGSPRIYRYDQFYIFKTYHETKPYSLCYKQLIPFLNQHEPERKHVLFSNVFMSHIFLNKNYEVRNPMLHKRMNVRFDEFMEKEGVDVILLNHQMYTDSHLYTDSTWTHFIQHYEDFGFRKIRVSADCDLEVLVK